VTPEPVRKRILLVDDHPVVREGLAQLINQCGDMAVCGEASDAAQALIALAQLQPDLAIIDISLKDLDGLELIRRVLARWPEVVILVLSMHREELFAERALQAGARGYVMKQEATHNVVTAIRRVLGGGIYLSDSAQSRLSRKDRERQL